MDIVVTGSAGFIGRNLVESLKNIRDGKDRTHPALTGQIGRILEYDRDTPKEKLPQYCAAADFVFHLAGVNRPRHKEAFMEGNRDFSEKLLKTLEEQGNACPVMLSSSVQATLQGRYAGSEYGKSKLAGEEAFFRHGERTGAPVYVYRFPNVFGKWCRPNYNSAVATFCFNIARDMPIRVDNRETLLELVYIDDLVEELLLALQGFPHRSGSIEQNAGVAGTEQSIDVAGTEQDAGVAGTEQDTGIESAEQCVYCEEPGMEGNSIPWRDTNSGTSHEGLQTVNSVRRDYCCVPVTHKATLGQIVDLLQSFRRQPETLLVPEIPQGSFAQKLYAAYLSYLPAERVKFALNKKEDARGSFTEILKTVSGGQFSVNVSKPGITKGQHWHHSKWEFFIVVSGHALIRERNMAGDLFADNAAEVFEYEVWGDRPEAVHMLPGYTHSIINLSDTEELITVMWASECFDPDRPDTFYEEV